MRQHSITRARGIRLDKLLGDVFISRRIESRTAEFSSAQRDTTIKRVIRVIYTLRRARPYNKRRLSGRAQIRARC